MLRFLLHRVAEDFGLLVTMDPKPMQVLEVEWNSDDDDNDDDDNDDDDNDDNDDDDNDDDKDYDDTDNKDEDDEEAKMI